MIHVKIKLYKIYSIDNLWLMGVKASVEQTKGLLILATGAQVSVLNAFYFKNWLDDSQNEKLSEHTSEIIGITPQASFDFHVLENISIRLSKYKFDFSQIIMTDLSHIHSKLQSKHTLLGLLGNDFFHRHKAIINYQTKMLELIKN